MSNSAIDAAIPSSYYSNAIFNAAETGWRRAQDRRLSTLASALDLDPSGSLRLTAWAAKVTPICPSPMRIFSTSRPAWRWLRGRR